MSFSLIAAIALAPLLVAPTLTALRFRELERLERAQIAVDNAAIALGRGDRAMLATLAEREGQLRFWDRAHHLVHRCPEPRCRIADVALEARVRAVHREATVDAQRQWRATAGRAERELAALGVAGVVDRAVSPPIATRVCARCGLPVGWHVRPPASAIRVPAQRQAAVRVAIRERAGRWDYRLLSAEAVP